MLKKKWTNKIISDNGFEISIGENGRGTISYFEGDKGLAIWKNSLEFWTIPEREEISSEKRAEILRNISDALTFKGIKFEIE